MIVTAFFKFVDLEDIREELHDKLRDLQGLSGLVLLTPEGINGTICGDPEHIEKFRKTLGAYPRLADLEYKDSPAEKHVFPRWKIDLRDQAINYVGEFKPDGGIHNHVSPEEWHRMLTGDEPVTVLDTRNRYETRVGTFKNAVDPEIDSFTEFAEYLDECDLPKDRPTLIYCTGGIRCEKAILDMEQRGFEKVYQLHGGILKYLEEYPNQQFEGECFVFDHRVAVDQELKPSEKYWLCPHCGDPGDLEITCRQCGEQARVCRDCSEKAPVCSKNCAYHWRRTKQPQ